MIEAIPWAAHQTASYMIYNSKGEEYGTAEIEITLDTAAQTYNIQKTKSYEQDETVIESGVTVVMDTLMPRSSYYDNESLMVILGAVSYEDGKTYKLNDTVPLTASISLLKIKYEGTETISTPMARRNALRCPLKKQRFGFLCTPAFCINTRTADRAESYLS